MRSFYESGGVRLGFRDRGAGLPIVFLHPTPFDGGYWRLLIEDLEGIRAIIPDLRGHGISKLGNLPVGGFAAVPDAPVLTMAQYADDILALLDHLKLRSAIFAGNSIGGYIMLELWRRAPERMRGMAFICSKSQPDNDAHREKRAVTIAQARACACVPLYNVMAETLIGATSRRRYPEIVSEMRARMKVTPEALVAIQAGLAIRPDSQPTIATIAVPVLAIAGGEDTGVTLEEMQAFQAAPGGCDFRLLPDAGHLAVYEQPYKVAVLMAAWLRQFEA